MSDKFSAGIYESFPTRYRFDYPKYIKRVTAGFGGETMIIFGKDKTCLYDCGMAYCHENLIKNIEEELEKENRESLDYVLMSHTHYDHIGALPYIIERWPNVIVIGAKKAAAVFASQGARNTMKRLGESANNHFGDGSAEIRVEPLRVDLIVAEGDLIDIGGNTIEIIESKGHTDCSLSYLIKPDMVLIASESTGVLRSMNLMHNAFIKSYADSIESAKKLSKIPYEELIIPHFGIVPKDYAKIHFEKYIECAQREKNAILGWRDEGKSLEEIYKEFEKICWNEERAKAQPYEAFVENYKHSIGHILANY